MTNSGITFTTCGLTFTFVPGDVDGGADTGEFIVGRYDTEWAYPTVGTKTSTSTQATDLTAFSDFQVGERAMPVVTVVKISSVVSDPVNSTSSPKRIPGAVIEYNLTSENSGDGVADMDSTVVTDAIDAEKLACDVTTGVTFTDGATASGLALDTVSYSATAAPGPYVYDYTPVPDGDGFDGNVTSIRITTTGSFACGGSPVPSFAVKFWVRVK